MLEIADVRRDKGTRWFAESDATSPVRSFVLVTYGSCVYWIEGRKVVAEKGDALLLSDRASFYGKSIPTLLQEKYVVAFRAAPGSLKPTPLSVLDAHPYVKWKTGLYDLLADRMKTIYDQWTERLPYRETMAQALLLETLVHASRELDRGCPGGETMRLAETMRGYIQLHHREPVTKERLAEAIGKSPNYAATLFRRVTGQTIGESVHAARIKTAQYMLRHSRLTVAEIAEYVGYADPSYFYRMFKKLTGRTPSELIAERDFSAD
ncbi:helix-turn-helix transcriptional regulator [Paenibacillus flagellatus]|uniref:AraC family transcriptional regulator n=1 Tax=Paenibacillus flagellatus TaxID=2211139 RepID=A0A2V5JXS0_9BACL|nr:AraC family transcriptional regulator [Paenibacillus flagellatus]PYI51608.1 AraC family transcriptional regulator [Paenibacillus flagellatus]